jgi:hypothetical protein
LEERNRLDCLPGTDFIVNLSEQCIPLGLQIDGSSRNDPLGLLDRRSPF